MAIKFPPFREHFLHALPMSPDSFAPETLYHYTAAEGVKGILLDRCLWATNFRFLNDPSEVKYGRKLVLDLLGDTQETLKAIAGRLRLDKQISEVYVFSLSGHCDDLSQWRAYGSAAPVRYCIGFDYEELYNLIPDEDKPTHLFNKVIYQKRDQCKAVQWWIDRAIRATEEFPSESQAIIEYVTDGLAELVPLLKTPEYNVEKEWRIIRQISLDNVSEVCFNTTRGVIRPYVKFPGRRQTSGHCKKEEDNLPPLPVKELFVLAPGREEISVKSADMLLRKAGLENVKAKGSEVKTTF